MSKITQRDRVLEYINMYGYITSYDAFSKIGCTQLATRISELKDKGYKFRKQRIKTLNMFGDKTHYDKYFLVEDKEDEARQKINKGREINASRTGVES